MVPRMERASRQARIAGSPPAVRMVVGGHGRLLAGPPSPRPWSALARDVAADRVDRVVFAASAALAGFVYSILLPFDFTQRISLANWRYLDARYLTFTAVFAVGIAWLVTLQVHAMRRLAPGAPGAAAAGDGPRGLLAAAAALLPSFLCCSPVVPSVVGLLGLSAATQLRAVGAVQFFFAREQDLLLLGASALLIGSAVWSTRQLARARCLDGACYASAAGIAGAVQPPRNASLAGQAVSGPRPDATDEG
jgi:hypothetical protein